MSVGAQPPNNLAAEAAVLGAILFDNRAYERVRDMLRPGDFYSSAHDAVFIACAALIEVGQVADGVTLREKFQTDDALNKVGGPAYLTELLESAAFGVEIIDYARIVRDLAVRRRLQSAGEIIASRAVTPDDGQSATDLVGQAVEDLKSVRDDTVTEDEWESSGKATSGVLSDLNERLFGEGATGEPLGLRTGLDALDKRLGGLHDGDLIIVAGRPSMGKTSLAMNMVKGVLETHHGARAALFSLEMGRENTAFRNASRDARIHGKAIVEYRDLRAGTISQRDMAALTEAQRLAQPVNDRFLIDVRAGLTIRQVEARARQARRALGGLDLLCIDYLQLIKGDRDYRGNRYAEVTDISMRLKELAKDLHCPVIALSQLSRQADHRTDHRPVLADLKESGSIEQDADSVVFCYRPEYYLERSEPKGEAASKGPEGDTPWDHWNAELSAARNKLHVIVDKNRHGPVGTEVLHVELASDTITNSMGDLPDIGVFL